MKLKEAGGSGTAIGGRKAVRAGDAEGDAAVVDLLEVGDADKNEGPFPVMEAEFEVGGGGGNLDAGEDRGGIAGARFADEVGHTGGEAANGEFELGESGGDRDVSGRFEMAVGGVDAHAEGGGFDAGAAEADGGFAAGQDAGHGPGGEAERATEGGVGPGAAVADVVEMGLKGVAVEGHLLDFGGGGPLSGLADEDESEAEAVLGHHVAGCAGAFGFDQVLDVDIEAGAIEADTGLGETAGGDGGGPDDEAGRDLLRRAEAHQVLVEGGVALDGARGQKAAGGGFRAGVGEAVAFEDGGFGVEIKGPVDQSGAEHRAG